MTHPTPVPGFALVLEGIDLGPGGGTEHLGGHGHRAQHLPIGDDRAIVLNHEEWRIDDGAVTFDAFDVQNVALFYLGLFAASADDRVHDPSEMVVDAGGLLRYGRMLRFAKR